ncbi:MAG TPA: sugar-binding protein [Gemmataceae bacterium]|nr:sugar-binding protein [Gemmataceae bacterium]
MVLKHRSLQVLVVLACVATACLPAGVARPAADPDSDYAQWSKTVKYNKSWIAIDWSTLQGPLTEGDRIDVNVDYYLDPSENNGETTLNLEALGPRVPKKDAPQPVSFENTQHLWYGGQSAKIAPGRGKHTFPLTIPRSSPQNNLLLIAVFNDSRGKRWPWDVRADAYYVRKGGFFELETDKPGNLFTYDEPVRVTARLKNVEKTGQEKVLRYKVYDSTKAEVASGAVPFTVEKNDQDVAISLDLKRRGTFLFEAAVDGWETRETTFCRIPDLAAVTAGKPTRLGFTLHAAPHLGRRTETTLAVARRLGLTSCRLFTEWNSLEPGPDVFALEPWDRFFDAAKARDVSTTVTIYDPPAWAMSRGRYVGYQMFECDLDAFQKMVAAVSKRYKGKFWGWEWLNEITPGGTSDYVADYVKLCRAGVESARQVDPGLHSVLAGGLWPRNYRLDELNAGAGKYVDVLPIHYGDGVGVEEARADLDSYGLAKVGVWDNESCAFDIQWDCPGLDIVSDTERCKWVMNRWTDELAAGCDKIIYFGGEGDAIGNGDYLLADCTPLPNAATLAVFGAKTFDAKPLGVFSAGEAGRFHLFERNGKALLVAATDAKGGEEISLAVGTASVRITDYQGNETVVPAVDGVAHLPLSPLGCFVEEADREVLLSRLVPAVAVPAGGGKFDAPLLTMLRGKPGSIPVRLQNQYERPLSGKLHVNLPDGWSKNQDMEFKLAPGERKTVAVPLAVPDDAPLQTYPKQLEATFDWQKLPAVTLPLVLSVISPESVGILLKNGDFEQAEDDGKKPKYWDGINAQLASSEGLGLGLGKHVLKFSNSKGYSYYAQSIDLRGGATYLYTAWVWNQGMEGGSNINYTTKDGASETLTDNAVFNIGDGAPSWQVFTCRFQAPPNIVKASFVPVVRGAGSALYDNVRVTVFDGSDFAAEAHKVEKPPAIDGTLNGWNRSCPIPLIGRNQLRVIDKVYAWTPQNLSGVAYLNWDSKNLYVAVEALDDVHHPAGDGETVVTGDSVILAFDPTYRSADAAAKSFAYYVSSQKPAGGSGAYTLYRPSDRSGGRASGQLARDSSVYDVVVKANPKGCVYALRIPWSELGVTPAFGGKFGFSIQLNDNDGQGLAAHMNWGGGLSPTWRPADFGIITLVEQP